MSGYAAVFDTPLPGALRVGVRVRDGRVVELDFTRSPRLQADDPASQQVGRWLTAYFAADPELPRIPLHPTGTPYQQRVWRSLMAIPGGQTRSYGSLAQSLASGPRAVAAACKANPIPLLVPCHRVVAANGLGGFMGASAGEALRLKEWLLRHEGAI